MANGRSRGGSADEQVVLLRGIWDEMKALNGRIEGVRAELGQVRADLGQRIDETNARLRGVEAELRGDLDGLRRCMVESETRLSTSSMQLSVDVRDLSGLTREWREEHRADRTELRLRIGPPGTPAP